MVSAVSKCRPFYDLTLCLAHLAKENGFDVVLIDTAGRMQDNEVRLPCSASSSERLS